jgi:excisionase family DNA binding protein
MTKRMIRNESLLTPEEAGRETGIGKHFILKKIRAGEIPAFELKSDSGARLRYRISRKDFETWLEKITVNKDQK